MSAEVCVFHPRSVARTQCVGCARALCESCMRDHGYCQACVAQFVAQRPLPTLEAKPGGVWFAELWGLSYSVTLVVAAVSSIVNPPPATSGLGGMVVFQVFAAIVPVALFFFAMRRDVAARAALGLFHLMALPLWCFTGAGAAVFMNLGVPREVAGLLVFVLPLVLFAGSVYTMFYVFTREARAWYRGGEDAR